MNSVLQEIYTTYRTTTPDGDEISLAGQSIDGNEVKFLMQIVAEMKPTVTLEIGFAFGVSTLAICDALQKTASNRHIVIDPFQNQRPWIGIGLHNIRKAGFKHLIEFHEDFSYNVLPKLLAMGQKIDLAFVDGAHTFDFVFVDFFYIDKLLPEGGIVVFDDADWPSVRKVIRYIVTNLPYSVDKTLPRQRIRKTMKRRIYEGLLTLGSFILNGICKIPGLKRPITRAFGAELLGVDKKYGLHGSIIALRKDTKDNRNYDFHAEF